MTSTSRKRPSSRLRLALLLSLALSTLSCTSSPARKSACRPTGGIDVSEMSVEDVERMVANREIPPFVVGMSCDF